MVEQIFTKILEHGGPAMAVAVLFLWYLHRQTEKKDGEIEAERKANRELLATVISDKERMLLSDAENRKLIERLIEKNGDQTKATDEFFRRSETNQTRIIEDVRALRQRVESPS